MVEHGAMILQCVLYANLNMPGLPFQAEVLRNRAMQGGNLEFFSTFGSIGWSNPGPISGRKVVALSDCQF